MEPLAGPDASDISDELLACRLQEQEEALLNSQVRSCHRSSCCLRHTAACCCFRCCCRFPCCCFYHTAAAAAAASAAGNVGSGAVERSMPPPAVKCRVQSCAGQALLLRLLSAPCCVLAAPRTRQCAAHQVGSLLQGAATVRPPCCQLQQSCDGA
jgi:hypothetical protein